MPFADKEEYRASHAARYAGLYRENRKFREIEASRKADWYALKASDPAWLAAQAAKKRAARAAAKKKTKKKL